MFAAMQDTVSPHARPWYDTSIELIKLLLILMEIVKLVIME